MAHILLSTLGVVCPACDRLNAPAAPRCAGCQGALMAAAPVPVAALPAKVAPPPKKAEATPSPLPPPPSPAPTPGSRFILSVVGGPARGQRFRLMASGCTVGRSKGAILFPDDPYVSPQHAVFRVREGSLFVQDEASASGVYLSLSQGEALAPGAVFAAGSRAFRYRGPLPAPKQEVGKPLTYGAPLPPGMAHAVDELLVGGRPGRGALSTGPLFSIGRTGCDLSFPEDAGLAPKHCEIALSGAGALLRDLSGGMGTFVRLGAGERTLHAGDRVRIGQQTLQVELSG